MAEKFYPTSNKIRFLKENHMSPMSLLFSKHSTLALSLCAVMLCAMAPLKAKAESLLLPNEISDIAENTFQSYRVGKVNQMLAQESECWNEAAREKGEIKKILVAACASTAMAGAIIEATYARSQRRGSHPEYTGEGARARIFRMSGLSETETQEIIESSVEPSVPAIIAGLQGAGMR